MVPMVPRCLAALRFLQSHGEPKWRTEQVLKGVYKAAHTCLLVAAGAILLFDKDEKASLGCLRVRLANEQTMTAPGKV